MCDNNRIHQLAHLAREGNQEAAADLFKEFGVVAVPNAPQIRLGKRSSSRDIKGNNNTGENSDS